MAGRTWAEWYKLIVQDGSSRDAFLNAVIHSLAQTYWRQRDANNLTEIEQILRCVVYLRDDAVAKQLPLETALSQVLVRDLTRFKEFLDHYYNKRINQDPLIVQLDHLADKVRQEIERYRAVKSSASKKEVKSSGQSVSLVEKNAIIQISVEGKIRLRKPLHEGHLTVRGNEYGVSRGGNFLISEKKGVFVIEPLDGRVGVITVSRATRTGGGDFLLNPHERYDCMVSDFIFSLKIDA